MQTVIKFCFSVDYTSLVMGRALGSARAQPMLDFFRASRARLFWKGLGPGLARARGQYPRVPVKGPRQDTLLTNGPKLAIIESECV